MPEPWRFSGSVCIQLASAKGSLSIIERQGNAAIVDSPLVQ